MGPRLSTTAVTSDVHLQTRPGGERDAALLLLRWLVDPANKVAGLSPEAPAVHAALAGFDAAAALARSGLKLAENRLDMFVRYFRQRLQLGSNVIMHCIGTKQTQRRECAGSRRNQDARHAELLGDRGRMDSPRTAERKERERAEVDAAL